jgi:phosphoglucomutase
MAQSTTQYLAQHRLPDNLNEVVRKLANQKPDNPWAFMAAEFEAISKNKVTTVATTPFDDQKPGTSGLRKKTSRFMETNYLENFIQATFDALGAGIKGQTLVVSGDGRFFNPEAGAKIIRMAAANGVGKVLVGKNFLMSTPCLSAIIIKRKAYGGFILTASHNPGGPKNDFGVKYNCENGGPAPEKVTNAIFENTKTIKEYKLVEAEFNIDVSKVGEYDFAGMKVEVVDAAKEYSLKMQEIFDFAALKKFVNRDDFKLVYDSLSGVNGPFAEEIFCNEFGLDKKVCLNATPLPDFGGGHPDPNLTYAKQLVKEMGLNPQGTPLEGADAAKVPDFGAAADGDADRNMILGKQFFVTPSDSVAILAANSESIPYFRKKKLTGVARSMPTSGALEKVATANELSFFEVPTGWKFFGNLMDADKIQICGEESFGTGSNHIREKDGLWAVLFWLSILADRTEKAGKLVTVSEVVNEHWKTYGRNYYTRYDFEGLPPDKASGLMQFLTAGLKEAANKDWGSYKLKTADEFEYHDSVDGSVSSHQGIRYLFEDGSRIIFRLSGTGSSSATIRLYIEAYEKEKLSEPVADALKALVALALKNGELKDRIGTETPTVIT